MTRRRVLGVLVGLVGGLAVLTGWTHTASSSRFCGRCHAMSAAVATAAASVHRDVACVACHRGAGAAGALAYLPSLGREVAQEASGGRAAAGILTPLACRSCHRGDLRTKTRGGNHPGPGSDCRSCHGDVAHPQRVAPVDVRRDGHPPGYQQTHGRDVAFKTSPGCSTCHRPTFCTACHARSVYPHPKDWTTAHGPAALVSKGKACTLCHSSTELCKGCHGTEIPHPPTWLGTHAQTVSDTGEQVCRTCHAPQDCVTCHARHRLHVDQEAALPGEERR